MVYDPTQQQEGDAAQWAKEPLDERHEDLLAHTVRPFNAEPPNSALQHMITPPNLHYRRQHTPVPLLDEASYRVRIGFEDQPESSLQMLSVADLKSGKYAPIRDQVVTLMCTGNRRSEMNTEEDGETMGLPWKNGSISTAKWTGADLRSVLINACGMTEDACRDKGYKFLTFWGLEDYHVSIPLKKAFDVDGECTMVWLMNDKPLPRDHGFPLRVIVPGFVGARSVKWIDRILVSKSEADGMHQTGIAYKQLGPNVKSLAKASKEYIYSMPPVDHTPLTSAITFPEGANSLAGKKPGDKFNVTGYALSGAGAAIIRVDVSIDGGKTWSQAETLERADGAKQEIRSGKAWGWVQWKKQVTIPENTKVFTIVCKAVDDQYQQQPHEVAPIWNLRGILNSAWPKVVVDFSSTSSDCAGMHPDAKSGNGSLENVGIKLDGEILCSHCRQRFRNEIALQKHCMFIHPQANL